MPYSDIILSIALQMMLSMMLSIILSTLLPLIAITHKPYQIVFALNCGSQSSVSTKLIEYSRDEMFQGLTSRVGRKDLPFHIKEQDRQLLSYHRVTDEAQFSYHFRIKAKTHQKFLLLLTFIETQYKNPDQRIIDVKLGDQLLHRVDIFQQAGSNPLHKYFQFQLRDEIIYVNQSIPALNAYIYTKGKLKLVFSKVKGQPKIQGIAIIKGDIHRFVTDFLAHEQNKNIIKRESISQKYHKRIHRQHAELTGGQTFDYPDENFLFYLSKLLSLKTIFSLVLVFFLMHHEQIYRRLNLLPKEELEKKEKQAQNQKKD